MIRDNQVMVIKIMAGHAHTAEKWTWI